MGTVVSQKQTDIFLEGKKISLSENGYFFLKIQNSYE